MSESVFGDNPGTQAPLASGAAAQPGATPAAGDRSESTQGGAEGASPAGQQQAGQGAQQGAQPLILGKFKTQADLEKAYGDLQRQHTKVSQELAASRRTRQAPATQAGQADGQPSRQQGPDADAVLAAFMENPVATLRSLVGDIVTQSVAPLQAAEQHRQFAGQIDAMTRDSENFPGFNELKPEIAGIFDQVPQLAGHAEGLKLAYWAARGQKAKEIAARAAQQGASDAERDLLAKLTVGSGGAATGARGPTDDDIANELFGNPKREGPFG